MSVKKMVAMPAELENVNSDTATVNEMNVLENNPPISEDYTVLNNKNEKRPRRIIVSQTNKIINIMKILLKLAKIDGYDIIGRIRNKNGEFLKDSDLITLINHSMTNGKLLLGESEFIRLLHEAKVEPELILNENVKVKLLNIYNNKDNTINEDDSTNVTKSQTQSKNQNNKSDQIVNERKILKRKRMRNTDEKATDEEVQERSPVKKRKVWETIESDNNEDESLIERDEVDDDLPVNWETEPH
jgi:hypothetical protein